MLRCRDVLTPKVASDLYLNQKKTSKEIAIILGMAQSTVGAIISEYGIKKQYKYFNPIENYFDDWNYHVAYILGMLMADGYIIKPSKGQKNVCIKSADLDLIEYIRNQISPGRNINKYVRQNKNSIGVYHNLMVPSNRMCDRLLEYNIFPKKTGKEILPHIPEEYKSDYLRGLFDGDGTVCLYKNAKGNTIGRIAIASASDIFLSQVKEVLCDNRGNIFGATKDGYKNPVYYLSIQAEKDVEYIYNYMYKNKDQSFYLKRKHDRFMEIYR